MNTHPRRFLAALLPLACLLAALLPGPVRTQTDEEHARLRSESPEFNQVERELSDVWKALTQLLPDQERKALVESQRIWIRTGRKQYAQEEARANGASLAQVYVDATRERTRMLRIYLAQALQPDSHVKVEGLVVSGRDAGGLYWALQGNGLALPHFLAHESELAGEPQLLGQLRLLGRSRAPVRVSGFLRALDAFAPARGPTLEPAGTPAPAASQAQAAPLPQAPAQPPVILEAPAQPDIDPKNTPTPRLPDVQDPSGGPL